MMKKLHVTYTDSDIQGIGLPPHLISEFNSTYGKVFSMEFSNGITIADRSFPVPVKYHALDTVLIPEFWKEVYKTEDICYLKLIEPNFVRKIEIDRIDLNLEGKLPLFDGILDDKSIVFQDKLIVKDYFVYRVSKIDDELPFGILTTESLIATSDGSTSEVEESEPTQQDDDVDYDSENDSETYTDSSDQTQENEDENGEATTEDINDIADTDYLRRLSDAQDRDEEEKEDSEYDEVDKDSETLDDYLKNEHQVPYLYEGGGTFDKKLTNLKKIKGIDETIERLIIEVIEPFSEVINGNNVKSLGGVLLYGPPGCGKTEIAYSIASDLGVKFYKIDNADISAPWVHETPRKIGSVFKEAAKDKNGAIIFIDEIDSLAANRQGMHNYEREIVNTILQEIDPKKRPPTILIIAATNDLANLDTAVTRSGRFDTKLQIPPPDWKGRYEILKSQLTKLPIDHKFITQKYVELKARELIGYVGADITTLVDKTEAIWRRRIRKQKKKKQNKINRQDFENAIEATVPLSRTELNIEIPKTTTSDLPGLEHVIEEIVSEFEYIIEPEKFRNDLSFSSNNGVLLHGPPGTGKTSIASAVANELNVLFLPIKAGELKAKYIGETGKNINSIFEKARLFRPILIYFDEIDSLGMDRSMSSDTHGNDSINALLAELSGENDNHQVLLIASTNRIDLLDSALLRNERFGKHVKVDIPDLKQYKKQSLYHLKKIPNDLSPLDIDELCVEFEANEFSQADVYGYFTNVLKYLVINTSKGTKASKKIFQNELKKLSQDEIKSH